ncbi:MAG: alpha/beta fold hydrolase [Polyangiaceae bacterium]|nr:alpha/beta fold hydrolase [Polyangiaceae bacterium]
MERLIDMGLPAVGVGAAAALAFRRWYRSFEWQTAHDEVHQARTGDGWNIGLYRYRPTGEKRHPYPLVCAHGMAGTRLIYDLHEHYSIARYLAAEGFDVWTIDWRGRMDSWPDGGPDRTSQWDFDDLVQQDFPAVVNRVLDVSGAPEAFWLGMEMSGQVLYAASIDRLADKIRGAVTMGSPVLTPKTALVPGVTSAPKGRSGGRVPFRGGAAFAGPVLAYTKSRVLESSFRGCNVDPVVVSRYFRNGIPDEATDLVDQFAVWIREGVMRSRDGRRVYSCHLDEVKVPLLMLAAELDLQRPAEAVEAAFESMGSTDKTLIRCGRAQGFAVDYGHDDLLTGLASPSEVFPRIRDWLEERSESP